MAEDAESFLSRVREVARECGYAIAVHGSEARDLDLVAVPWTPEATSADQLVARLCEDVPMVARLPPWLAGNREAKPWGRLGWMLAGCPDHLYVDLSAARTTPDDLRNAIEHERREALARVGAKCERESRELERLRVTVQEFEKASGLKIGSSAHIHSSFADPPEKLGRAVRQVLDGDGQVERFENRLRSLHRSAAALVDDIEAKLGDADVEPQRDPGAHRG
jgi:hypothetical protein